MKDVSVPTALPNDVVWGVAGIAEFCGIKTARAYALIRQGVLPAKKLGPRIIMARKSELTRALSTTADIDATPQPKLQPERVQPKHRR